MDDNKKLPPSKSMLSCCNFHWRGKISILAPLITLPILIHGLQHNRSEFKCIYLIVVMAIYWITECLPLYVTSLFPIIFLPLFGILSSERTCSLFFTNTLVMFIGGLVLALAIEYSNLHKRIALGTILLVGCSPRRLHFGLIIVTSFLSMWISNSACTAMMCPIVKAILNEMEAQKIFTVYMTQEEEPVEEGEPRHPSKISMAFYFGTAYASSIGGVGTLIGTGTNLTFKGIYETRFPDSKEEIDFPIFMAYAVPITVVVNVLMLYISLQLTHMALFRPNSKTGQEVKAATANKDLLHSVVKENYKALGKMTCHEVQVASVFALMVVLLFTVKPGFMTGWGEALDLQAVESSAIVFFSVVILFALPTQYTFFKYCCGSAPFTGRAMDACLSWTFIHNNMPWGLCFLIGGGFALAEGSKVSGMAKMLGESMSFIQAFPRDVVIGVTIVMGIACTAFSSNVAVCNILTPVFCEMALAVKIHPLLLTLPATLAMSFAYHLPVSTPPNAIISGYGNIKTKYMAVAGILPTLWGIILPWVNAVTWGMVVFPESKSFPDWAKDA
ncbi:LOW QUALITY PROTEIN: protein I'm not dead yet 2-like [Drosophila sulfurigaster albostrigata]|uniref:LOW QUALITY PROTEIN: protein I'm not dead yet 2-like n=1 Tax=Drosophila sulfurigaster albostrigata TaxID=89887 RepID=UPI002D21C7A7|nr:LOW QUALITY PROTEIN: protein I'm not dead yet 2-like [Drosophila sulfurigaster albostrigata]